MGIERIRDWPFVSLKIKSEHLAEWSRLAERLGRSRSDLMRQALEEVGLPFARAVAQTRRGSENDAHDESA